VVRLLYGSYTYLLNGYPPYGVYEKVICNQKDEKIQYFNVTNPDIKVSYIRTNKKEKKMDSNKKEPKILEDVKINVKTKLSALWVALVFFYLYNDVISFFRGDIIEEVIAGKPGGVQISQQFLFGMAALMAIPIVMVFLSLALRANVNRWVNIILGIFHIGLLVTVTLLVPGETWAYYALYMVFEAVFMVLIVYHAWKWPTQEA